MRKWNPLRLFGTMAIPRRMKMGFALLIVFVLITGGLGLAAVVWLDTWSSGYNKTVTASQSAAVVAEASANMVIYGSGAATETSPIMREQNDAVRLQDRDRALNALNTLEGLETEGSDDALLVKSMRSAFYQCDEALAAVVTLGATDPQKALSDVSTKVVVLASQLGSVTSTYLDNKQAQERAGMSSLTDTARMVMYGMIGAVALAVLLGVLFAWRISRNVTKQLQGASASISSSASQLLAVSSQVAAGAAQTAASTNETTATVEEVKQTAILAQEKASQLAENSQHLVQTAEAGQATVEDTIARIEIMQNQMETVVETINRLSDQTQAVGDIIQTVNDLAEQSNLLSVNASIEAAKAGDFGKGFTVVAQEVKSLATQSKQAVAQVRTILHEIQNAGQMAVQAAEQGRDAVEAGRQQSRESGDAIEKLAHGTGEAAQAAIQISASSRQQLAGMEQIGQAIGTINEAGSQSVTGTRQVEHEVKQLQDLALRLKRLVDARATA
jgi:hypothetical protein